MTVKQLDDILGHELLVHSGTHEEFIRVLGNAEYTLRFLYGNSLKFMLFENEGMGYVRLQNPERELKHDHIVTRFCRELEEKGNEPNTLAYRGGGDVKAQRANGKTTLSFYGVSGDYGGFNRELLRQVLEEHLDKRIGYRISNF